MSGCSANATGAISYWCTYVNYENTYYRLVHLASSTWIASSACAIVCCAEGKNRWKYQTTTHTSDMVLCDLKLQCGESCKCSYPHTHTHAPFNWKVKVRNGIQFIDGILIRQLVSLGTGETVTLRVSLNGRITWLHCTFNHANAQKLNQVYLLCVTTDQTYQQRERGKKKILNSKRQFSIDSSLLLVLPVVHYV